MAGSELQNSTILPSILPAMNSLQTHETSHIKGALDSHHSPGGQEKSLGLGLDLSSVGPGGDSAAGSGRMPSIVQNYH